jgi:hypothetical protein
MHSKKQFKILWLAVCASLGPILPHASAVITLGGTGNNFTTPPNNIGNFEGQLGTGGGGTTISKYFMLTATHVSGNTTGVFTFGNQPAYHMVLDATLDDLAVWQIAPTDTKTFATFAPVYTGSSEAGLPLEVAGYGVQRGPAITGGWLWGAGNGMLSWGTNTVSAVDTDTDIGESQNFGGDFLQYDFNNNGNSNEAITANNDSGGGVFVLNNGVYQLAGVNSLVDTVLDSKGNPIQGALYDQNGYFTQASAGAPLTQITTDTPDSSFATRISSKLNFIGLAQGTITPANAAAFPINNDGNLSIYTNMTTGAITGGALLSIGTPFTPAVNATLQIARNSGTSLISSLTIAPGSSLDITNNRVIIEDVTNPAIQTTILSYLASGYNGGKWNGSGITSSVAASGNNYGVAFGGHGVVAGLAWDEVEVGYALYGDTNLDGVVNGDDFSILVSNLGRAVSTGWEAGDFNYDGVVNSTDFTLFMNNFGRQAVGADIALPASDIAALDAFAAANHISVFPVPEPASLAILSFTGITLLARRRQKS